MSGACLKRPRNLPGDYAPAVFINMGSHRSLQYRSDEKQQFTRDFSKNIYLKEEPMTQNCLIYLGNVRLYTVNQIWTLFG